MTAVRKKKEPTLKRLIQKEKKPTETHISTMARKIHGPVSDYNEWFIDSGASDHITGNSNLLVDLQDITPFGMKVVDEHETWVTGKGTIHVVLDTGKLVELQNVLYSEEFGNTSLLYVSKMTSRGLNVQFVGTKALISKGKTSYLLDH